MTHETYLSRTAPHRGTVALQMVQDWIAHGSKIRPCRLVGRGKRTANDDHTARVRAILDALRCKYNSGNDAPRGGLTGQWIHPDRASWRKLAPVREVWQAEEDRRKAEAEKLAERKLEADKEQRGREAQALATWNSDGAKGESLLIRWGLHAAAHSISIRTAPAEVREEKDRLNVSWNEMKALRKPHLTC